MKAESHYKTMSPYKPPKPGPQHQSSKTRAANMVVIPALLTILLSTAHAGNIAEELTAAGKKAANIIMMHS